MLHIPIQYNSRVDTNAVIKTRLYEAIKTLSQKYIAGTATVVDLPGPHVIERTHQFNTPGFSYFAAEHNQAVRNEYGAHRFFGREWWDVSNQKIKPGVSPIISFDGTMSPITYLTKGHLENTLKLCDRVDLHQSFILNLCFTRRANASHFDNLIGTRHEWLLKVDKICNVAAPHIRNEIVTHVEDILGRKTIAVQLGDSGIQNVFNYGSIGRGKKGGGTNMTNIIIPCQKAGTYMR